MTMKEQKLFAFGVGAGVLSAALVVGFLAAKEMRPVSAASNTASPAASTRSDNGHAMQQGTEPGTMVELTPAEISAAGVQVAAVRTAALKTDIAAFGRVEQPEAQLAAVSARIGGRVDKLYVQYTGERVRSGQPIADIYRSWSFGESAASSRMLRRRMAFLTSRFIPTPLGRLSIAR